MASRTACQSYPREARTNSIRCSRPVETCRCCTSSHILSGGCSTSRTSAKGLSGEVGWLRLSISPRVDPYGHSQLSKADNQAVGDNNGRVEPWITRTCSEPPAGRPAHWSAPPGLQQGSRKPSLPPWRDHSPPRRTY